MKDKKDKTIKSPVWKQQKRDEKGRWLNVAGERTGKRIYTQADIDREISQAFLSGTKQSREVIEIVRPDYETLKRAFIAGTNASKSGLVTPSIQFERWAKSEGF